jgi:hypothetical protein
MSTEWPEGLEPPPPPGPNEADEEYESADEEG